MAFESAHQSMETGLEKGTTQESDSSDLSPETTESADTQEAGAKDSDSPTLQDIIDLDKVEKFKMHGEEWTRDQLASAMLRQADYTRKTQEFAKERKYYDNLAIDIANVLKEPRLVEQFKKIYPEKFHQYLEPYSGYLQTKPQAGQGEAKQSAIDPQLMSRINQIEGKFRQQEVESASVMLDGIFSKYSKEYPYADEASVISRSLALMEQKQRNGESDNLSREEWSKIFKSENDRVQKLAEARYKETTQNQMRANRKAKDVGSGGDAVGQSPKRLTMKEATEAAIRDLGGS
jgi:hypothetical protein